MRYWLVNSAIPMFVVLCGMSAGSTGCSKNPNPNDIDAKVEKGIKTKEALAMELAMSDRAAKNLLAKDPAAKEIAANDLPAKELVLPDLPKLPAQEIDAKEIDAKELPVDSQEAKKEKDTPKEIKKDKEPKKEPTKETKKEPPEPTEFLGKDFAYWLKQLKDRDPSKRDDAFKAVLMFGPKKAYEAVPEILTQLERHMAKKNPIEIDLAVRVNGIMALSTIFRYAQAPRPDEVHINRALVVYKACLRDPQIILKLRAVQGLPYLGAASHGLIDEVIVLAKNPSTWELRKEAIQTLALLASPDGKAPPHVKVMPVLRQHMDPKEEFSYLTRSTSVQAIAMLAQDKMPPELYKALEDPTVQVRLTALQSIAAVSRLLDAKKSLTVNEKKTIARQIGVHLETYLSGERDEILRIWTYATIMTVTKNCTKADLGSVVKTLTKTTDLAVKIQALTVISLCEDKGKPIAYDAVLPLIHEENLNLAGMAMAALISMRAAEAIPELKKIVDDKKPNEIRKETAEDAILALEYQVKMSKEKGEKDKKTPEKK